MHVWLEMSHDDQWEVLLEIGPTTRLAMQFLAELRFSVNHSNKWELMLRKYYREYGSATEPMLVMAGVL